MCKHETARRPFCFQNAYLLFEFGKNNIQTIVIGKVLQLGSTSHFFEKF